MGDFEKYQAQQTGAFHLNDLTSHPHMTQILQQLLDIMQQNQQMNAHFNNSERSMGARQQGSSKTTIQQQTSTTRNGTKHANGRTTTNGTTNATNDQRYASSTTTKNATSPYAKHDGTTTSPNASRCYAISKPNGRSILVGHLQVDPSHL